ncbi:MAG: cysteine desulfurase CsdA [Gemmatimonadetes bacterium]|nr:cysteine desulfurase CsdA [Gemmatimonadota bacterium]
MIVPAEREQGVSLDVVRIRADFPVLQQSIHGNRLVYLDSAATSQTPEPVVRAIAGFYRDDCANVHRGVHELSRRATDSFEGAREKVRHFINAESTREIIFTRGTTDAINLVAQTFGRRAVGSGDEVILSALEHHSNIVPWQMLCDEIGARLRVIPMFDDGTLDIDAYRDLIGPRTKMVALVHISNALGTTNPIKELVSLAHDHGIPVLVDGAQAVPHVPVDVRALGCDFYAFSAHKMYGPTGIGALYGREEHLNAMPPYQGGGDMIRQVTFEKTVFNAIPHKFEAGTPNIAGTIGMGAAIDYIAAIGRDEVSAHEARLVAHASERLSSIGGVRLIGTAREKVGVVSFVVEGAHPHDVGTILDHRGVAIRAGHHCAQPVMDRLGIPATARASFGIYNDDDDVDALVRAVLEVREVFA